MPDFKIPKRWIPKLILLAGAFLLMLFAMLVAGILFAWTHFAGGLPPLQGWHLDAPASEFTASGTINTLADYLKNEDTVFQELAALMKGPWIGNDETRFSRFEESSICNPARLLDRNWNRSYVLESPKPIGGVLLLHGLSDSPYSLRTLGVHLHSLGYTVVGLRLPGHGTCPAALAAVKREDWTAAVRLAVVGLQEKLPEGTPLVLVGFSNGGALSVNYALESLEEPGLPKPQAIVLFSPMIGINPMAKLTRWHHLIALASGDPRADWSGVQAEVDPYKYNSWPMNASVQAWDMTQRVETRLELLKKDGRLGSIPPILAFQSAIDSTVVVPRLITELFDRLPENGSELVVFDVNRVGWLQNLVNLNFEKSVVPALKASDRAFTLKLVTNESADSLGVVVKTRKGNSLVAHPLDEVWPAGVFSLSHVALPIPPEDPVYGTAQATEVTGLPLGSLSMRGENGSLRLSDSQVVRLRHNPFYHFAEDHAVGWLDKVLR